MSAGEKEVLDAQEDLRRLRLLEEPQWREIAALLKPEERDIGTRNQRARVADEIFDSTPLYAVDQFVGGLFNQASNPADRWFELGLQDRDLAQWGPVREYLWAVTTLTYGTLAPAVSGFYANIPAVFGDLGVFGLGSFYSDLTPGAQKFTDICVPLSESFIDTDGQGNLTRFHREWRARGSQLKRQFGKSAPDIEDSREAYIVHAVYPNHDFRPGAVGRKGMAWLSTYCSADIPGWRRDGGYYELPFHSIPWTLRSGRVWPIGPGHIARADAAMLNEMERSHIVAAQFAAEPITLLHDEGVLSAADIQPNKLLYGTVTDEGKPLVQSFTRNADVKLSMAQSEQRRNSIKEAFYFSLMQLINRPQMTATEVLSFKEEQLRLMGPNLGRIHTFGLAPFVARRVKLLQRAGMMPPPPPELHGQRIEITFTSPLAKAQKAAQGKATMQWIGAIGQIAQMKPDVADNLDGDKAAAVLLDALGPPPEIMRAADDVQKDRQARAAEQQQQMALAKAQAATAVMADGAHAMQAATASRARVAPGGA
ncbi:MAG: head-tail connector protein [Hyphomicrobiales bacterium]|nr:head-tail connector protein [Hyphomicrobiales bacterium]